MKMCRGETGLPYKGARLFMADLGSQIHLVGKLFILMSAGFLLRRKGILTEAGKQQLTDLIIDLVLPCSIVSSFLTELTVKQIRQALAVFLLSIGTQLFSCLLGYIAYRRCREEHRTVMQYGTVCSNSGILGTPIAEGLFGAEGTYLAAIFLIPLRVVMWTLGLSFFTRKAGTFSLKRIVTHPCIAAVGIGSLLMVLPVSLPSLAVDCLHTIGVCNTALAMLLTGGIAADMDLRLVLHPDTWYFTAIRLLLLPLAVFLICGVLGTDPLVRNVTVILTAMPAGSTTSILALKYGGDAPFASACTALTTVLSLLAVPVWCAVLL